MITVVDVKDWLKQHIECKQWYAGAMRSNKEESITVFNGNAFTNIKAIGGVKNTSYYGKGARILVNWNKNIEDTEIKALEIYEFLNNQENIQNFYIHNKRIVKIDMRDSSPVFLGVDDEGVYQYVIDIEIIIER